MSNPFFYGGRVTDPERFVGRKAELGRIFAALETAHTGQLQSISVVGPRRIGRSSLLYHLTQVYRQHLSRPDDYVFAYVDLQESRCQTLPGLLGTILEQFGEARGEGQPITLVEFEEVIRGLSGPSGLTRWPVVCLDEFEQLTRNPQEFSYALYNSWRSLMNASRIAFVTASQTSLDRLSREGKLTSPFFNVFMLLPLGEFTLEEAQALVDRGRTCDRPFSDEDCQRILKLAGRHPCRLQVACSLLYEAKGAGKQVDWGQVRREYRRTLGVLGLESKFLPSLPLLGIIGGYSIALLLLLIAQSLPFGLGSVALLIAFAAAIGALVATIGYLFRPRTRFGQRGQG